MSIDKSQDFEPFIMQMIEEIRQEKPKLVLPEAHDPRVIQATEWLTSLGVVGKIYLLGKVEEIHKLSVSLGVELRDNVEVINPESSEWLEEFSETFYELRKAKGVTLEEARDMIKDVNFFGAMMVRKGIADAMVSGSMSPTADVVRAGIWIVRPAPGVKYISGAFIISLPDKSLGHNGLFIFADSGVIIDPTPEQLAYIAINSAKAARIYLNAEPIVAFLSYSTKGSAGGPSVEKIREAMKILKELNVDFVYDGELQLDAAVSPEVAKIKCPDSPVGGRANVLIFPNLDAGNIGYKLAQRFAKAGAYGPLLLGLNKPVNDLSRGCFVKDIVITAIISLADAVRSRKSHN